MCSVGLFQHHPLTHFHTPTQALNPCKWARCSGHSLCHHCLLAHNPRLTTQSDGHPELSLVGCTACCCTACCCPNGLTGSLRCSGQPASCMQQGLGRSRYLRQRETPLAGSIAGNLSPRGLSSASRGRLGLTGDPGDPPAGRPGPRFWELPASAAAGPQHAMQSQSKEKSMHSHSMRLPAHPTPLLELD